MHAPLKEIINSTEEVPFENESCFEFVFHKAYIVAIQIPITIDNTIGGCNIYIL
jgi:hypothetical protein